MPALDPSLLEKLTRFARALVDQERARVIVEPQQAASGFWFGGGNLVDDADGTLYLVGRYRNAGDSRTGLAAGERGLELALFASQDRGRSFDKILQFAKSDLDVDGRTVLSIEGTALHWTATGVELFISTEKDHVGYPAGFEEHLKQGTGVWSIERLAATTINGLRDAPLSTVVASRDPRFVHVKDPFLHDMPSCGPVSRPVHRPDRRSPPETRRASVNPASRSGYRDATAGDRDATAGDRDTTLLFCSHPFCWTSSNTGYTIRKSDSAEFEEPVFDFFPRGFTWDVAMTRGTCVLDVAQVGAFADRRVSLVFYDGGEDDDPQEHAKWAAKLKALDRNPGTPWKQQSDLIRIDEKRDYISDKDGGRSFYTSLGHPADFDNPTFTRLLLNGIHWAAGVAVRENVPVVQTRAPSKMTNFK